MGYARGKFGVEYQPHRQQPEGHPLLWFVVVVVLLVSSAFTYYRLTRQSGPSSANERGDPLGTSASVTESGPSVADTNSGGRRAPGTAVVKTGGSGSSSQAVPTRTSTSTGNQPPPPQPEPPKAKPPSPPPPPDPNVKRVQDWLKSSAGRPSEDCVRLERLLEAELKKNPTLAIDAIRKLCNRATLADLQDPLLRRLGELNLQVLFSGQNNPLVTSVTAKRGDSRDRIARENRTTPAAIVRLNPKLKWERLKPGDAVRVLFVPSPTLVIYRKRDYADLSLKGGTFFNRYDVTVKKTAPSGTYPISSESSESVWARFRELGITAQKRAEIEMFLAPGARIIVADQ